MEEGTHKGDFSGISALSTKSSGSFKISASASSSPKDSPSLRRSQTLRTSQRGGAAPWFWRKRLVLMLSMILVWTYFELREVRWVHDEDEKGFIGFMNKEHDHDTDSAQDLEKDVIADDINLESKNLTSKNQGEHNQRVKEGSAHDKYRRVFLGLNNKTIDGISVTKQELGNKAANDNSVKANNTTTENQGKDEQRMDVVLTAEGNGGSSHPKKKSRTRKRAKRILRGKSQGKQKTAKAETHNAGGEEQEIPVNNSTYKLLVGPFGPIEDKILEWSPEKRTGTCDRKGDFARLVWSRRFLLIFHELSMTGAPISMMELASELMSCGATVSVVTLSKKGGLMPELERRRIKVLDDRAELSFKAAKKSDLVIAGSAVCASWIDNYIAHNPAGASQIGWWIMENRREYFDRSKAMLHRVKMLFFLSHSQLKLWLNWCEEEKIKLRSYPAIVPLSVNDELAFVAGIKTSLNTPSFSTDKMMERRQLMRDAVRKEMGLTSKDVLVMTLSSINPGKGHFLFLEAARLLVDKELSQNYSDVSNPEDAALIEYGLDRKRLKRKLLRKMSDHGLPLNKLAVGKESLKNSNGVGNKTLQRPPGLLSSSSGHKKNATGRELSSSDGGGQEASLRILIGSVGSKGNKLPYVKGILNFLSQHQNLNNSMLWTPATTRVASLYSAADVYVMNSQGVGETFGRVTIEAMAFGIPVLGTDAGGTINIVEHNVTGLLHPVGRAGVPILAQNLQYMLANRLAREKMGAEGRKKVERMYLKRHMLKELVEVIVKCMRTT